MTENRTDGPGRIAREAEPLLRDLLTEWQRLFDALWNTTPAPGDRERYFIINRQVDLFGTAYLLAALRHLDRAVADRAAHFLAEMWDAGDSLGEWIYEWRQQLDAGKPLTLFLSDEEGATR
jgi:hypothetical protein